MTTAVQPAIERPDTGLAVVTLTAPLDTGATADLRGTLVALAAEGRLADLVDRWKVDTYPAADLMPSAEQMPAFLGDLDAILRGLRQARAALDGQKTEWTWQRSDASGLAVRGFPMPEAAARKHVADLNAREDIPKRGWRYGVARRVIGQWIAEPVAQAAPLDDGAPSAVTA